MRLIVVLFLSTLWYSCKTERTELKYQDKPDIIACENMNYALLKEAFYSFENDLYAYAKDSLQVDLESAYTRWLYPSQDNTFNIKTLVSPYTVEIFERLKIEEPQLFNLKDPNSNLNYQSTFISCIAQNMNDPDLKTTFNALLNTKSMSPKLFGDALTFNLLKVTRDPYMRYYVVFEYGYGRMFFTDFSEIKNTKSLSKVTDNE